VFLDDGYCTAAAIELDPDTGCATYTPSEEASKEQWDEEEDADEWEDDEAEDDEEETWDEEEDEF
jgi:hypothetical protein